MHVFVLIFLMLFSQNLSAMTNSLPLNNSPLLMAKPLKSWQQFRERQLIRQQWDSSCGAAAMTTILNGFYGFNLTEKQITLSLLHLTDAKRVRLRKGFSLLDLKRLATIIGLSGEGYGGMDIDELINLDLPAILPVRLNNLDHFVVFRGYLNKKVLISDPAFGNLSMSKQALETIWMSKIAFFIKSNQPLYLSSSSFNVQSKDIVSANVNTITPLTHRNLSFIPLRTLLIKTP